MPRDSIMDALKKFCFGLFLLVPAILELAWRLPFGLLAHLRFRRALRNIEKDFKKSRACRDAAGKSFPSSTVEIDFEQIH